MPKRIPDIEFPFIHSRTLRARFDEAPISTDGGAVLLRHIDHLLSLIRSLAAAIPDRRDVRYIEHTVAEQMGQRVFGIALGYEDCNDTRRRFAATHCSRFAAAGSSPLHPWPVSPP